MRLGKNSAASRRRYPLVATGALIALAVVAWLQRTPNAASTYEIVHAFSGESGSPFGTLVSGPDGRYYGTTHQGGVQGRGSLYAAAPQPDGTLSVTTVHEFSGPDGSNVYGELVLGPDGRLYGTASAGGANGMGTIYAFSPSGGFSLIHSIGSQLLSGLYVGLVAGRDGLLYGVAGNGGGIFRVTPSGDVSVLGRLESPTTGANARAALIEAADGDLYGTAISGGPNGSGTVFRVTKAGTVTRVHGFSSAQGSPWGGVMQAQDGYFYGTTTTGGATGGGILYRVDAGGDFQVLHDFAVNSLSRGRLLQAADGLLYGTTRGGGVENRGVVFRIGLGGSPAYAVVQSLTSDVGQSPETGLFQASTGEFFGTTTEIGSVRGSIYRLPASGASISRAYAFPRSLARLPLGALARGSDGSLYGVTNEGGTENWGSIYRIDPSGAFSLLRSFSFSDGARPGAGLILAADGRLYGTAMNGGAGNQGVVFRIATDGTGYTVLHAFNGALGSAPQARLVQASDGYLYGTAPLGGAYGAGTIFRISAAGTVSLVHSFTGGAGGVAPRSELLQGSDGSLYGTTAGDNSSWRGTVFRMDLSGAVTTLHNFTGPDGSTPNGLVQTPDGYLYGVAREGGSINNAGLVYRISPAGAVSTVAEFPQSAMGVLPSTPLLLSQDGRLYGTASAGGSQSGGTLFRVHPATGKLRVLHNFETGSGPGALIETADDERILGVAQRGPNGGGVVFRFTPDRAPVAAVDAYSTAEDSALTVPAPGVLGNDVDDGGSMTAALLTAPPPSEGVLALAADGSFTFTPQANFHGSASFSYKALDAADESDPVTVTISVTARNDAPVVDNLAVSTAEDTNVSGVLPWSDLDDTVVTFRLAANGSKGTATIDPQTGSFVYAPGANASGLDTFTFVANDGDDDSNVGTVTVTIAAVNDAPAALDDVVLTNEDAPVVIQPLAGDVDVDGDALTIAAFSRPRNGRLTQTAPDRFQFAPAGNFAGSDSFTYTVGDGSGLTATATVRITVTPVNDAPVAHGQTIALTEDIARVVKLSGADADDNPLSFRIVGGPAHGTLSGTAPALTYAPAADYTGTDSFAFVVNDGTTDSQPATVTLTTGSYAWVSGGPDGGRVNVIATDPGAAKIAYAATDAAGLFKTMDGGATWVPINGGLTSHAVLDVAVDPVDPNVVYAGTRVGGLWKSVNGGGSWSRVPQLLSNLSVADVAIDPANPVIVYAATSLGLYKSNTAGASWTPVNAGLTASGNINQLVIDPQTSTTIYAGTSSGVFKTTDGAALWTPVNSGLPASRNVAALDVSPDNPRTLLLSLFAFNQVYRSVDGGATWSLSNQGLATGVSRAFARNPAQPGVVYTNIFGRLYRSVDDGVAWSALSSEFAPVEVATLAVSPVAAATVYAGTLGAGAYRSSDGGMTFTTANAGLAASAVASLAVDPHQPSTLVAGNRGAGVTRSIDGGASWHPRTDGVGSPTVFMVAGDSGAPGTFYAATPSGLFKTTNDGGSWTFSSAGVPSNIQVIAVDPGGSGAVYAGTFSNGVYKTANRGASWSAINTGLTNQAIRALAVDPSNPGVLYAGTNAGVFKSTDAGATWGASNTGLTFTVQALAVAPGSPATVYAGTLSGLYRSTDAGATWARHGLNSETIRGILLDPADPALLLIASGGAGVFRSRDGGQTWAAINAGLQSLTTSAIVATADTPRRIYVGTESGTFELIEAANDPPIATAQSVTLEEDTSIAILLTGQDPDGDALSFTLTTLPAHGTLIGSAPNLTYTPAADYSGPDSFAFTVSDGAATSPATVSIDVTAVNDVPVAPDQQVATVEDTAASITLAALDGDGDPIAFAILSQPAHGTLSGAAPNLVYTPAANYYGADSFTYRALDATSASATATVTIAIAAVNDSPVALPQSIGTGEDTPRAFVFAATDADGDALTYSIVALPLRGSVTGAGANLTYTPLKDFYGTDSFTVSVSDGAANAAAIVTVTVTGSNDPPIAAVQTVLTVEDTPVDITLWGADVEGAPLTFAVTANPAHGVLSGVAPKLTYTPAADYRGPDSFTFTTSDGTADSAPAVVTITVAGDRFVLASPGEAVVRSIAVSPVNPAILYAGAGRGLFRSDDGGASWLRSGANFEVNSLTLHPTSPATIYSAGSFSVTRSTDGGANWQPLNGPSIASGVVIDPSAPDTLYTRAFSQFAVMKSTDGGTTWVPRWTGLTARPGAQLVVQALAIDARNPSTLFAGVGNGGGVFRSIDGAGSWQSVGLTGTSVFAIVIDPTDSSRVYLLADGRVRRTLDGGTTWTDVHAGVTQTPSVLAVDTAGVVYAAGSGGVFVTSNHGNSWARFDAPASSVGALTVDPVNAGTLYLAGTAGLFKSTDSARSWSRADAGIVTVTATAMLSSRSDPNVLYVTTDAGTYMSGDSGKTWQRLPLPASSVFAASALLQDPIASGTIYAALGGSAGLFRTTDAGVTWSLLGTSLGTVRALGAASTTGVLYAANSSGQVYKSADNGMTWSSSTTLPGIVTVLTSPATQPSVVYAGTSAGVFRTIDAGATWALQSSGLSGSVQGLAIDPTDPLTLYASASGLFKTTDGGASWIRLTTSVPSSSFADVVIDPRNPQNLYVSGGNWVLRSTNAGATWQSLIAGLPHREIHRIIVAADSTIYAAPWYAGVWKYTVASNDAPRVQNQVLLTPEDTPAPFTAAAVDPDNEPVTFAVVTGPLHGTLSGVAPNLIYHPAPNYHGPDSFTFTASDGKETSAPAVVSVTVSSVNDAPDAAPDAFQTSEDTPLVIAPSAILGNDVDAEGDSLALVVVAGPAHGSLVANPDGTLMYAPAPDYFGPDAFTYRASDGALESGTATVTLTVHAVNDAPTAIAGILSIDEDATGTGTLTAADVDSAALSYRVLTNGSKGTAAFLDAASPAFIYTPDPDANGADTIVVGVSDGQYTTPVAIGITIRAVNDAPVASDGALSTDEDVAATGTLRGSDKESSALSFTIVANGAKGNVVITDAATGAFTYTPVANANGPDSFTFRVSDGELQSDVAIVAVSVTAINDVPVAQDVAAAAPKQSLITGQLIATDVDGNPLTYTLVQPPAQGSATVALDGTFTYVSSAGAMGVDRFTFKANDGFTDSAPAAVSVTILGATGAPVAFDAALAAVEDSVVTGTLTSAAQAGRVVTYAIVSNGGKGSAVLTDARTGAFTYTPAANATGDDSFTFRVHDGIQSSNLATVSIAIAAVNDAPVASAGSLAVTEDRVENGMLIGTDVDGEPLTFALAVPPSKGTVIITNPATGRYTYTPYPDQFGSDNFSFSVRDGVTDSATAAVTVVISNVNDGPEAADVSFTTTIDAPLAAQLPAADPDNDPLTFTIQRAPRRGTITAFNPATGGFVYVPAPGFSGQDTFTFRVSDGIRSSLLATVTIVVRP